MTDFTVLQNILTELLDIEAAEITEDTYLIRELNAESIDFLELAVLLQKQFGIDVADDQIFLKSLRAVIDDADPGSYTELVQQKYPHLSSKRVEEIVHDLAAGPALRVKDILAYIQWKRNA